METTDNYPINYNILAEDLSAAKRGGPFTQEDAEWMYESLNKMCNAYDDAQDELDKLNDVNQGDIYFPERSLTTTGFDSNVMWTPFVSKDGRAGMRCQKLGNLGLPLVDEVTYFYFNPSSDGAGQPDVFIYEGPSNDPALDGPLHYYTPDFEVNNGDK
jgi:hypothetical protein